MDVCAQARPDRRLFMAGAAASRQVMVLDDTCKLVADPHAAEPRLVAELKSLPVRS